MLKNKFISSNVRKRAIYFDGFFFLIIFTLAAPIIFKSFILSTIGAILKIIIVRAFAVKIILVVSILFFILNLIKYIKHILHRP